MRRGEVLDVQIVAHAGAIRCRVVAAEHGHMRTLADHGLAGDLGQQGRSRRRLADAPLGSEPATLK